MKSVGWLLLGVGLVWVAFALSQETSVVVPSAAGWPNRVENLSLLEHRRTHLMLSVGTIVVGVLLVGFGRLLDVQSVDEDLRTCPFCAEDIRFEAIVCKHCGRNLSEDEEGPPLDEDLSRSELEIAEDVAETSKYSFRDLRAAAELAERAP